MKIWALRGLFMILGYALAVLVATTVVCIVFLLPIMLQDDGSQGSFYGYLSEVPMMLIVGSMMTAMHGFPGWLITVIIAERRRRQGKYWFALAGVLTAALAMLIMVQFQDVFSVTWLNVAILIGGFCGGLAYWALAGKTSGNWKSSGRTEP